MTQKSRSKSRTNRFTGMPLTIDEFMVFAEAVAKNESDYAAWQRFAVTHYAEERIEKARIEIVRICNDDDSIGNEIWPLTESAANQILDIVKSLGQKIEP
jgi:hypothetical protein